MKKITSFESIGYMAATFPVDEATQTKLKQEHLNPATGNVDINDLHLAVKLNEDGTVGFGTGTAADALLGVIIAYEMDGFASVQLYGGLDNVPTASAITGGIKGLAVDAAGAVVVAEGAKERMVVKPSAADELFASIVL